MLHRCLTSAFALVAGAILSTTPAWAGHTAIDQDPNTGEPIQVELFGYCDLNGDDCTPSTLPYQVSFGGGSYSNQVTVHGNGPLTFGGSIDFDLFRDTILDGNSPALTDYGLRLVSPGQHNGVFYDGQSFEQSAELSMLSGGAIRANYYTCLTPLACYSNPYSVTLTPTLSGPDGQSGFNGEFDFSNGDSGDSQEQGYVINGVFTPTGDTFFLPASFEGFGPGDPASGVPELDTWAMILLGFGAVGAALRARRAPIRAVQPLGA